jgi:putative oxidoreductase
MHWLFHTHRNMALTIVRVMLGVVFFPHGAQKLLGWYGGPGFAITMDFFEHQGIPTVFAFLAIAAEFFGALGLLFGFLTRIAAFGIFVNMIVAIATVNFSNGMFMNWTGEQTGEGFEFHLLVIAIAAALMLKGAGALSVDRAIDVKVYEGPHTRR